MIKRINYIVLFCLSAAIGITGCQKLYDIPGERDYISPRANYTLKEFGDEDNFVLGRTSISPSALFNADNSSFPMKFEIRNMRFGDGTPTSDLLQEMPTRVWIKPYTGLEKSLQEINEKRKIENRPMFEVRSSGQFVLWNSAQESLLKTVRDTDYLSPQKRRFFDLKISNSGGERIIRDFQINVFRARPYEPSEDIEPYTLEFTGDYNHPGVNNITGIATGNPPITGNDVNVYMKKVGNGQSLTFKFFDKDSAVIDPNNFNETKWDKLVHGFNMEKTNSSVKYDVAYPIPLATLPTIYTGGILGSGREAVVEFSLSRKKGRELQIGSLTYNFKIFEEGDWEMVFHFTKYNPKFEDE